MLVITLLSLTVVSSAVILPVIVKLCRTCRVEDISPEWIEAFSASCYYPMQRLLSSEDFEFLSRQPGFEGSLKRKLRRDRLQIFRKYLDRMILDFNRLHALARFVLSQSPEDCSELVSRLLWLRVRFAVTVFRVEFGYRLYSWGLPSISVGTLISCLEGMAVQLASIGAMQRA